MTTAPTKDLPIKVIAHEGSEDITIEWDETHPVSISLGLDEWTEDQWLDALESGIEEIIASDEGVSLNEG